VRLLNRTNWWQILSADVLLIILAYLVSFVLNFGAAAGIRVAFSHFAVALASIGLFLLCYYYFGLYYIDTLRDRIRLLFSSGKACMTGTLLLIAYVFAFDKYPFPKSVMLSILLANWALIFIWRSFIDARLLLKSAREARRVLIVGAGNAGARIATQMRDLVDKRDEVVGFIDDDPAKTGSVVSGFEVLGTREQMREIIRTQGVDRVVIAMPSAHRSTISEFILICNETSTEYSIVPSFYEIITQAAPMDDTANLLLMSFFETRIRKEQKIVKRIFDVVASIIALIVLSPLFLIVALPVLYKQQRVMKGGKLFKILKFRTMVAERY